VHDNWKQAIVDAAETDTVFLNRHTSPSLRALRTERSEALEFDMETNAMTALVGSTQDLYFGGDMNASLALTGQVAGRITEVEPVNKIISECAAECIQILEELSNKYSNE